MTITENNVRQVFTRSTRITEEQLQKMFRIFKPAQQQRLDKILDKLQDAKYIRKAEHMYILKVADDESVAV